MASCIRGYNPLVPSSERISPKSFCATDLVMVLNSSFCFCYIQPYIFQSILLLCLTKNTKRIDLINESIFTQKISRRRWELFRSFIAQVVMDEFHYFADPDRGAAWELPLWRFSRPGVLGVQFRPMLLPPKEIGFLVENP